MLIANVLELGLLHIALAWDHDRAASLKVASGGRVAGIRHIARQDDALSLLLHRRVRDRTRGES